MNVKSVCGWPAYILRVEWFQLLIKGRFNPWRGIFFSVRKLTHDRQRDFSLSLTLTLRLFFFIF